MHAPNTYGWKDGTRESGAKIRWLLANIKRKIAKRIKEIGRADGHGRGLS